MDDQNHDHEVCLGLGLGLGLTPKTDNPAKNKHVFFLDLSIPLHQSDHNGTRPDSTSSLKIMGEDEKRGSKNRFPNGCKEEYDDSSGSNGFSRKKLRLTRDQTTLLEDSFRQHATLNTAQKQALADKLNLKPRQVEVWFQNRRARTKLKQTEVDCEMLKKTCERLSEENRRLKKELSELRSSLNVEKPPPAAAVVSQPPLPFLHYHIHKSEVEKSGTDGGGGEKKEAAAAAVVEVVHGLTLAKCNDDEQKLGFVGGGKE